MRGLRRRSVAVVALALVFGLPPGPPGAGATDAPLAPHITLTSVTGERLELDHLRRDGPVLLDFWATWCGPCLAALPEVEALRRRFGPRGLTVIAVSVDGPRNFPKVRPFARRLGLGCAIVLDEDGSLQQRFQVRAVPTSVLISPEGHMVRITQGWRPGETSVLAVAIEALLADSTGAARP